LLSGRKTAPSAAAPSRQVALSVKATAKTRKRASDHAGRKSRSRLKQKAGSARR
jgi:hypothetical protein